MIEKKCFRDLWFAAFCPFLDLHLSISDGSVFPKHYDKRDDFDFYIVNFG